MGFSVRPDNIYSIILIGYTLHGVNVLVFIDSYTFVFYKFIFRHKGRFGERQNSSFFKISFKHELAIAEIECTLAIFVPSTLGVRILKEFKSTVGIKDETVVFI